LSLNGAIKDNNKKTDDTGYTIERKVYASEEHKMRNDSGVHFK
jgi:hypothetical protein